MLIIATMEHMVHTQQDITDIEPTLLPDWLAAPVPALTHEQAIEQLKLVQYPIIFEKVLENIAAGRSLRNILACDLREFEYGDFMRWIKKDPDRHLRYKDAKELRTETWAGEIIDIADAENNPLEDVNRSKLRIDSRKYLMAADNQRVYGDRITQQIEGSDGGPLKIAVAVFTPDQLQEYAARKYESTKLEVKT